VEIKNNGMTIKEIKSKVRELRNEAADLDQLFHRAAISYLNTIVEVVSCESSDTDRKACLEEISAWYNSNNDLVTIEYVIMNKYGDFTETKTIQVCSSELDKYILI